MSQTQDFSPQIIRIADIGKSAKTSFEVIWDYDECAIAADILGAVSVNKMKFKGHVSPSNHKDWELNGILGASVIQTCVITLEPVKSRIDIPVVRRFLSKPPVSDSDSEVEIEWAMEEEPLEAQIDINAVALEIIAMGIPDYPRTEGAELEETNFTAPGEDAMTDEDARPFGGLAALKDKLEKGNS
jgi:uncharacterized metal-binding protein YceD (DUF177 family)